MSPPVAEVVRLANPSAIVVIFPQTSDVVDRAVDRFLTELGIGSVPEVNFLPALDELDVTDEVREAFAEACATVPALGKVVRRSYLRHVIVAGDDGIHTDALVATGDFSDAKHVGSIHSGIERSWRGRKIRGDRWLPELVVQTDGIHVMAPAAREFVLAALG